MNFNELRAGLRVVSPQGDTFEIAALNEDAHKALVRLIERSSNPQALHPISHGYNSLEEGMGWINRITATDVKGRYVVNFSELSLSVETIPTFTEGEIVKDREYNVYEVTEVVSCENPRRYRVKLLGFSNDSIRRRSTKYSAFEKIGDENYIYNTQNSAALEDDFVGEYQLFATELKAVTEEKRSAQSTSKLPLASDLRKRTKEAALEVFTKRSNYAIMNSQAFIKLDPEIINILLKDLTAAGYTITEDIVSW